MSDKPRLVQVTSEEYAMFRGSIGAPYVYSRTTRPHGPVEYWADAIELRAWRAGQLGDGGTQSQSDVEQK